MEKYKNEKEFENSLRKSNDCSDNVKINNIIFTMDNYDSEGKEISYGNKRTETGFIVHTENRYENGFFDAIVDKIEDCCLRNDIVYLN